MSTQHRPGRVVTEGNITDFYDVWLLHRVILSRMTEPSVTAAVRVAALAKRFGGTAALDGVDLEVASGEAFGMVGANGAGKTTLIKCLLDLCAADSGEIEIFGKNARHPRRSRRAVLSARALRAAALPALRRVPRDVGAARRRAATSGARLPRLLAELDFDAALLARPVRSLSKGMAQKLGLAGCFLVERDLYVLDEPMSGLDPAARVAVKSVLRRLGTEGRTLFFTSHVLADVEELCSAIAVLDRGRVRFHGSPAGLRERYAERDLERAYMRCIRDQ